MPELPEVETIARTLREGGEGPALPGRCITGVTAKWPRHFQSPKLATFRRRIKDQRVLDVGRRGKYLVFLLERGTMLIHLRMSGDLRLTPSDRKPDRYEHTLFHLDNRWDLRFSDARKFGRVSLVDDPRLALRSLGPEPLDPSFTPEVLADRLHAHHRILKPLLLDQSFVAGIGNIYADEALHIAGLHPLRRSDSLDISETHALWKGIREALQSGLKHNGASIDWVYRGGSFQNHFRVYGREGEPCPVCGKTIKRIVVGQRGTHLCSGCQPEVEK
ncbi:MAG: DNA-formamidopyrimidine glycosylase [Anaerolineales bacterium]|jgi:formamidopyrimidine-DNA glycosylase